MSVLNDVLEDVVGMASLQDLYSNIVIGALPPDNGISITPAVGGVDTTFLTKGICYQILYTINGKHRDQKTVTDALNDIHEALTQRFDYPSSDRFQITNISTISLPTYLDREQNSQWLYGSSIQVDVFVKRSDPNESSNDVQS